MRLPQALCAPTLLAHTPSHRHADGLEKGRTGLEAGLITAAGVTNVSVVAEGSGAEFRMHKMDYVNTTLGYAPSPDRMGITLSNVSGVELRGLTVSSSGGDGIYMAGVVGGQAHRTATGWRTRLSLAIGR